MKRLRLTPWKLFCLLSLTTFPVHAQTIIPAADGTTTLVTQDGQRFIIHGGSLSGDGQNLFHSFQEFGLNTSQIADFLANPNLRNILGRVTSSTPSTIDGLLRVSGGNANLFLMNPSGIIFGPNASLDVSGSFTATTADAISFAGGQFNASGPNNYSVLVGIPNQFIFNQTDPAAILNQGDLAVGVDQHLTLAAGSIINEGSLFGGQITVAAVPGESLVRIRQPGMLLSLEIGMGEDGGRRTEAGGERIGDGYPNQHSTLNTQHLTNLPALLAGGNLHHAVAVETAADGSLRLIGSNGNVVNEGNIAGDAIEIDARTLVNRGSIDASGDPGGSIQAEVDYLVNAGDIRADGLTHTGGSIQIEATERITQTASARVSATGGTHGDGGTVVLDAGDSGTVILSGRVDVSARDKGNAGGRVEILGEQIGLLGAAVDASGDSGGGTVLVGGDYQGRGNIRRAQHTAVNPSSRITVDALTVGDGGTVVLWADGTTDFDGTISARGGLDGGDGGTLEVSGLQGGRFAGTADAAAPAGDAGMLLLDPKNITITDGDLGLTLLQTLLQPTPGADDQFGTSVAIDGNTVVVGAIGDDTGATDAGAAYLFDASSGNLTHTLLKPIPITDDQFGTSVAIDGNTVVVGAIGDDTGATDAGAAYLFDASSGSLNQTLLKSTPVTDDEFGTSVAIAGNTVVVGAIGDDTGATDAGAAYLFDASSGSLTQTLLKSTPVTDDQFGHSVAIDGNTVVVGTPGDDTGVTDGGAAYLFDASSGSRTHTLLKPIPVMDDNFGESVAIDGNTVVVGAIGDDTGATDAGTAYLFDASSGNLTQTLANPTPAISDDFGASVAIDSNIVVVGTSSAEEVYLFDASSGSLTQTLSNPTPAVGDRFGGSVAIDGSTVVAGAALDDTGANNAGAVYLFDAPTQFSQESSGSFNFDADLIHQIVNSGTDLTLQANNDITINEAIQSNNPNGSGGALILQAGRSILINADIFTDDGNLTLLANEAVASGVINSSRDAGDAVITIDSNVTLNLGSGSFSATLGSGEGLDDSSRGNITLGNLIAGSVQIQNDGSSGGSITTGNITTNGGAITLMAQQSITASVLDSSSSTDNGGNVTLDPVGDVQVTAINAQGGTEGTGGTVDVTAGQFFRATGSFTDRNGILASISTAGGQGGGAITIRHGGAGTTPFIVGDASTNGTAAAITSGDFTLEPTLVLPFTTTVGNIQVISTDPAFNTSSAFNPVDLDAPTEIAALNVPTDSTSDSLPNPGKILNEIEQATGVRPGLIYVLFAPQAATAADLEALGIGNKSLDAGPVAGVGSEVGSAVQWRFTAQGLSSSAEAQLAESRGVVQAEDPLDLLLVTADGEVVRRRVAGVTRQRVQQLADRLRRQVTDPVARQVSGYLVPAQQLYQWLVAPLAAELAARGIENLVFVLDPGLRSLPLAALHDGDGFLVERYSVGLMPSLALTDTRYVDIKQTQVLAMGASEFPGQEQTPLPAVPLELATITSSLWSGLSVLNQDFTPETLYQIRRDRPFGILHLATHAKFAPGRPDRSYIQWWDEKLSFEEFRQQVQFFDPPIELLVLSACKTAVGDPEAELGFAGMAVQAGVKTALGSLWYVNDEGTMGLMTTFYGQLQEAPIKAEALRRAQVAMLKGEVRLEAGQLVTPDGQFPLPPELVQLGDRQLTHPFYWSGFTMIGNPW